MTTSREEPKSMLEQLLSPEHIDQLRVDAERWRKILDKKAINVLLVAPRPDNTIDASRREGLLRILLVVEELLEQHQRAAASGPAPGKP